MAKLAGTAPLGTGHDHNNIMSFAYALGLAARGRQKITVLDWGGVFGAHYMIARTLYPDLELDYTCKEVPLICRHGRELNPEVRFVDSDDEAMDRCYDVVFVSSTLQYEKNWTDLASRLAAATAGYLFITRTPVVEAAESFVVVQRTPSLGTAYQGWFINRRELLATLKKAGMALVREFLVMESFPVPGAPEAGQGYGCLMRPAQAAP
jgi:putative methyltransferase (TIGR04325 family)